MKTTLVLLVCTCIAATVWGATNLPPVNNDLPAVPGAVQAVSDSLKPLLELLGGKGPLLTTVIAWVAALGLALATPSAWISQKLRDALNRAASTSDLQDDEYLRRLFSKKWYGFAAFLLRFVNIDLPTLSELERAIRLQQEAVVASKA